jgi:hypothetical protein
MKNIRRIAIVAFISFLAIQGFSQTAPAAAVKDNPQQAKQAVSNAPGKYIDNNKNGICDRHEAKSATGKCINFADKNNDGICDNKAACCQGKGKTNGCGQGCQNRHGQGNCCGAGMQHRNGCGNPGNCSGTQGNK